MADHPTSSCPSFYTIIKKIMEHGKENHISIYYTGQGHWSRTVVYSSSNHYSNACFLLGQGI